MGRYLIGIDLGTTNSAVAYVDTHGKTRRGVPELQTFPVPQLVAAGEVAARPLLPSFLYLPSGAELPPGAAALPWDPRRPYLVGQFAHAQGARVPGRLVTSAKSWLCHAGVDRSAKVLPWGSPPDVERVSPVEASARYLRHMAEAWNFVLAGDNPDDRIEHQQVVLTVPASFDDVARTLTVEAARAAGLVHLTLLEEPQAAFYCWLATHPPAEADAIKPGTHCLVVDVGGGTSDFSLIRADERQGELLFVREAVGDHLLLGGDNMDLALAKFVEAKLAAGGKGKLDAAQFAQLTQACRHAKEILLGAEPPASHTVTIMGRGRSIVGGSLSVPLSPEEVRSTLFDGFFPETPFDGEPHRGARGGLHEMGLPYVSDPAVTRHLAQFLRRHAPPVPAGGEAKDLAPSAILFNGGVFQPEVLQKRLIDVMRPWFAGRRQPWNPLVLTSPSLDLAVAIGAAHYAWLRHSGGRRIGGGIARSYYVAVGDHAPAGLTPAAADEGHGLALRPGNDLPGSPAEPPDHLAVVCVVPKQLQEGEEVVLREPELELALGQPVLFPLYTSTVRADDKPGDVLRVAADQLRQLPPLHSLLRGGKRSGTRQVPVSLAAKCTEIGTLELFCVAKDGANRWRLEFNVRDLVREDRLGAPAAEKEKTGPAEASGPADVWPEAQVQAAAGLIRGSYTADAPDPRNLTRDLEAALEASRGDWPTGLCRRLWEFLAEVAEQRRKSPAHLTRWYNLAGFCLRPGYGESLDRYRMEQLWKLLNAPPKAGATVAVQKTSDGGGDHWVMWRRLSGGLNAALQHILYERLRPVLLPGKKGPPFKPNPNELAEMWRAAGALERLDVKHKDMLGGALLKQVRRSPVPPSAFWSLTRLGARVLLYGPLNTVLHPDVVQGWIDALIGFEPGTDNERLGWAFCLAQLARRSGQRALDVDDAYRDRVLTTLRPLPIPADWIKMVEEVSELEHEAQSQMFGEALPIGLRLLRPADDGA